MGWGTNYTLRSSGRGDTRWVGDQTLRWRKQEIDYEFSTTGSSIQLPSVVLVSTAEKIIVVGTVKDGGQSWGTLSLFVIQRSNN